MRIAQLCPYDFRRPGGVQYHIRDLSVALRGLGHEVTIIAPTTPGGDDGDGAPSFMPVGRCLSVSVNKTRFEISLAGGREKRRLADLLAEGRFDVIHYHAPWTPLLPVQLLMRSRSANVATFHDVPPDTAGGATTRAYYRLMGRAFQSRLGAVIATSEASAAHLGRGSGLGPHVVPPCIDLKRFTDDAPAFERIRDGRVNILFLGRMDRRKGVLDLLAAYGRLCGDGLNVRLILAGAGDQSSAARAFVRNVALPHVELPGAVHEGDKARWFASCDIFCSPALEGEGFGLVLVEAMASGKPVVAVANRGYRAVLRDRAENCLATPGDIDSLYKKLKALVVNDRDRRDLGAWGRREAPRYDSREIAPRIVSIYDEALSLKR